MFDNEIRQRTFQREIGELSKVIDALFLVGILHLLVFCSLNVFPESHWFVLHNHRPTLLFLKVSDVTLFLGSGRLK